MLHFFEGVIRRSTAVGSKTSKSKTGEVLQLDDNAELQHHVVRRLLPVSFLFPSLFEKQYVSGIRDRLSMSVFFRTKATRTLSDCGSRQYTTRPNLQKKPILFVSPTLSFLFYYYNLLFIGPSLLLCYCTQVSLELVSCFFDIDKTISVYFPLLVLESFDLLVFLGSDLRGGPMLSFSFGVSFAVSSSSSIIGTTCTGLGFCGSRRRMPSAFSLLTRLSSLSTHTRNQPPQNNPIKKNDKGNWECTFVTIM